MQLVAANFHLLQACNAKCRYCFATFRNAPGQLSVDEAVRIIGMVRDAGALKVNFVGGEPTLYRDLAVLIRASKALGLVTSIVTNGAKLHELLASCGDALDWVGLSVDSASDDVNRELGRGGAGYVERSIALCDQARALGVRVKLNTVVTRLNHEEDMSDLVCRVRPERWKVFQALPVEGQNDGSVEPLLVTNHEFEAFIRRHEHLRAQGLEPVPESNDAMTDSYAMIDPLGRFFGNTAGKHRTSRRIVEVGVQAALDEIGFKPDKLIARGGHYDWTERPRSLSVLR